MRRLALLAVCLLVAAACNGDGQDSAAPSPQRTERAQRTPKPVTSARPARVMITSPATDTAVQGDEIVVEAQVIGSFQVVDKLGRAPKAGEGHIHYYLDVEDLPREKGKPAVTDDEKTYHAAATTSYTWENVDPGKHRIDVQLVNNDHTPLDPPERDTRFITVEE